MLDTAEEYKGLKQEVDIRRAMIVRVANVLIPDLLRGKGPKYRIEGLPDDAVLVGVSTELQFDCNQVAFKFASNAFEIVPPGCRVEVLELQCIVDEADNAVIVQPPADAIEDADDGD